MSNNLESILDASLEDGYLSKEESEEILSTLRKNTPGDSDRLHYLHYAIKIAAGALSDKDPQAVMKWLRKVSNILDDASATSDYNMAYFAHHDNIRDKTVQLLKESEKTLDICMYTLSDNVIADTVTEQHKKGVKTRIITDDQKIMDPGSDIFKLKARGINVRIDSEDSLMHHKFAVIDNRRVWTGSYNWTRTGAEVNNENFLILDNPTIVQAYIDEFKRLWEEMTPL